MGCALVDPSALSRLDSESYACWKAWTIDLPTSEAQQLLTLLSHRLRPLQRVPEQVAKRNASLHNGSRLLMTNSFTPRLLIDKAPTFEPAPSNSITELPIPLHSESQRIADKPFWSHEAECDGCSFRDCHGCCAWDITAGFARGPGIRLASEREVADCYVLLLARLLDWQVVFVCLWVQCLVWIFVRHVFLYFHMINCGIVCLIL